MRLADYRKKEPYEKAEGARRTVGRAIRRDFPPKPPLDAANELAVITDIMERNRGLYGYDVPPAPRFRSGRKAYEAETARMGGHLGLLGEVGTAQATLGVAEKGRLGRIGAERERGRAYVEAFGLTAGATELGHRLGLEGERLQERGLTKRWGGGITEKDKWAVVTELVKNLVPRHEAYAMVFGGKRAAGQFTGSNEQLDADIATAQAQEQPPEEIEGEEAAVRRYSPDKTRSAFEAREEFDERLSAVRERIRRARELSERLRTR